MDNFKIRFADLVNSYGQCFYEKLSEIRTDIVYGLIEGGKIDHENFHSFEHLVLMLRPKAENFPTNTGKDMENYIELSYKLITEFFHFNLDDPDPKHCREIWEEINNAFTEVAYCLAVYNKEIMPDDTVFFEQIGLLGKLSECMEPDFPRQNKKVA